MASDLFALKTLITRSLTGLVFVSVVLGMLWLGPWTSLVLFTGIIIAGLMEFYRLPAARGIHPELISGISAAVAVYLLTAFHAMGLLDSKYLSLLIIPVSLIFANELYRRKDVPFENIGFAILGVVYVAVPFSLMNYLLFPAGSLDRFDPGKITSLLILIWVYDSFAYLTGITLGKHRLFERISPKKSWEGAIGGTLFCLAAGWLLASFSAWLNPDYWYWVVALIILFGTYGDLIESLLKRSLNVKDSGSLLPGHGGILDRFDALMYALPAIWMIEMLFK